MYVHVCVHVYIIYVHTWREEIYLRKYSKIITFGKSEWKVSRDYWYYCYNISLGLKLHENKTLFKKKKESSGWCGLVDQVDLPACKSQGRWFDSQSGTCLGCRPGPQWGAYERQPHNDVSLSLFLPPFPSLKINK